MRQATIFCVTLSAQYEDGQAGKLQIPWLLRTAGSSLITAGAIAPYRSSIVVEHGVVAPGDLRYAGVVFECFYRDRGFDVVNTR